MDKYDVYNIIVIGMSLISILCGLFVIIDGIWYTPFRAEDAQNQCLIRGFDVYSDYKGIMRTKAYGVKCAYVDYSRKQIDIDSGQEQQDKIIVVT